MDIGAYEYQTPVSKISYAWLQQYGLPITTNIDTADLDGTGFNVYQDWIAGLNPTNALSVLAMLPPVPTNNPAGLVVSWESVSNITYFLQSSTNLGTPTGLLDHPEQHTRPDRHDELHGHQCRRQRPVSSIASACSNKASERTTLWPSRPIYGYDDLLTVSGLAKLRPFGSPT